ncbi:protein translocase subunit SecD [Rhodococcus antarcticus]|uniref:Protein translocase subunit SecD n=1 Tax=Rhodococcus antarcticus TaxID=2987751 RepID=A0ABY6P357_9NOCA|nr:protein translocase subunit SecD [Rhodococcus antarcticus]UZJ26099.1 protein translocase subunit SecD [Rhodococcus antarcticus]
MAPQAGQVRPARYLSIFAVIVVGLYALVFFTGGGSPKPKLGIDLQGGTRVTLTATTPDGQAPSQQNLDLARQIIETRVNGIGVSGSEVVIDGSNLVITVPGDNSSQARSLGQTAKLSFRGVIGRPVPAAAAAVPAPAAGTAPATTTDPVAPPAPAAPATSTPAPQGRVLPAQAPTTDPAAPTTAPASPTPDPATQTTAEQQAAAIAQAKATRQSTDPATQQAALAALDCAAPDPLLGNDDPALPLVTCDQNGAAKYVLDKSFLDGQAISDATSGVAQGGVGYDVRLSLNSDGLNVWSTYTAANVGRQSAFVLDAKVVSAPTINGAITTNPTLITGSFSQSQASSLAESLKYGSLPLSFTQSEAQTVSASLGAASLEAGLLAGGIGLILVLVYCLAYYRLLGILTALSLVLSFAIVYAVMVLLGRYIGFTLDLSGIAGLIVAIGITADSFVIYFERLKDEVREGRSFRSAVPRGWIRARRTILSADAVSFLAAAVLYLLAVGQVKGFAFTLGVSTVLDLVVVFLVTHPLVALASRSKVLSKPSLTGLGAVQHIAADRRAAAAAASTQPKEA